MGETKDTKTKSPPRSKKKTKAKAKSEKKVKAVKDDDAKVEMAGDEEEPNVVIPYAKLKVKEFGGVEVVKKKLEMYLSNAEFREIFKMSRSEFNGKPAWKQRALKKTASL